MENTRPGFFISSRRMLYSRGVRLTGSPSTVTDLAPSSMAMPPLVSREGLSFPPPLLPPRLVYRRSWLFTRAITSMGLKGLVM